MTARAEQLIAEAMKLPEEERCELVERLAATLAAESDAEDLSPEWRQELDRRLADIEAGRNLGRPIEEVMAGLRARLQ